MMLKRPICQRQEDCQGIETKAPRREKSLGVFTPALSLVLLLVLCVSTSAQSVRKSNKRPFGSVGRNRPMSSIGRDRPMSSVGTNRPFGSMGRRTFSSVGSNRPFGSVGADRPFGTIGSDRPFGSIGGLDPETDLPVATPIDRRPFDPSRPRFIGPFYSNYYDLDEFEPLLDGSQPVSDFSGFHLIGETNHDPKLGVEVAQEFRPLRTALTAAAFRAQLKNSISFGDWTLVGDLLRTDPEPWLAWPQIKELLFVAYLKLGHLVQAATILQDATVGELDQLRRAFLHCLPVADQRFVSLNVEDALRWHSSASMRTLADSLARWCARRR